MEQWRFKRKYEESGRLSITWACSGEGRFWELEKLPICLSWCLRMLEFRVRCEPENVTVTCAVFDCSFSTTFVHSLNFLLWSSRKHSRERMSNFYFHQLQSKAFWLKLENLDRQLWIQARQDSLETCSTLSNISDTFLKAQNSFSVVASKLLLCNIALNVAQ